MAQLLQKTEADDFLRDVWEGRLTELTGESIEEVAKKLQAHPKEFSIAFGVKGIDRLTPMQVVSWLLQRFGIAYHTYRQRVNGKITRRRVIDQEELGMLKDVFKRRNQAEEVGEKVDAAQSPQADPPPQNLDLLQGGGSPEKPFEYSPLPSFDGLPQDEVELFSALWMGATSLEHKEEVLAGIKESRERYQSTAA